MNMKSIWRSTLTHLILSCDIPAATQSLAAENAFNQDGDYAN